MHNMANLNDDDDLIIDQIYEKFTNPVLLTVLLIADHCANDLGVESDAKDRIQQYIREQ
jgi:hypothetical protein